MAYEAYIVEADYTGTYKGQAIDGAKFDRIALRASDELDKITFNRVRRNGLSSYASDVQDLIKLATCAIAESLALHEAAAAGGVVTTSESVGGYSYSVDKASIEKIKPDGLLRAKQYLMSTGLISAVMGR